MADEIEDLSGVGETTAEKLKENGYKSLEQIAVSATGKLMEDTGLGEKTARNIISGSREALDMGYATAKEVLEKRKEVGKIETGSDELNTLLGGGIETQSITELYSKFGTGKTQLAFQLAVNVQKPKKEGGLGKNALFIDTEGTFRPERVRQMAKARDMDEEDVLNNIFLGRAYSSDHQMLLAEKASDMIEEKDIGLIIVDSLTGLFRAEYVGRGQLGERQQKLNRHMHTLQRHASTHNAAVLVTNQVMANPGLMFGDPTTPIGGHIVGHASSFRIYLRKSKGEKRIARLVDSPCLPDGECVFKITGKGVEDK